MNQNPEQKALDNIDKQLIECGWLIQRKKDINLFAGCGVAVKEYQAGSGSADMILFVDQKPVGVIEAKKEEDGYKLTTVEEQSAEYSKSKLKYLNNDPLPFVYESTGVLTHFTDYRDPKPRAREEFTFHRPETFSHADDIISIVREKFGEGNAFCKKITYNSDEDPKSVLSQFRNTYNPRIAVTVDMIATGTDVKPLECLIFMRDVKSKNYFEQMKGRGTRTIPLDDLDNLPDPDVLANDIVENIEAALENFREIMSKLD